MGWGGLFGGVVWASPIRKNNVIHVVFFFWPWSGFFLIGGGGVCVCWGGYIKFNSITRLNMMYGLLKLSLVCMLIRFQLRWLVHLVIVLLNLQCLESIL